MVLDDLVIEKVNPTLPALPIREHVSRMQGCLLYNLPPDFGSFQVSRWPTLRAVILMQKLGILFKVDYVLDDILFDIIKGG